MEIWLKNDMNDDMRLPINPEEINRSFSSNLSDIVLANGEEVTTGRGYNLRQYEVKSFFPKVRPHYAHPGEFHHPFWYVKKLEKWAEENTPILLQVTTTNINEKVTIRDFDWSEKGGAVGDIEFSLSLKEYKPVTFEVIETDSGSKDNPNRPPSSNKRKSYTVKRGDSLWKIAARSDVYGKGSEWRRIYNRNKSVVGKNPNLIYPGQELVIPR